MLEVPRYESVRNMISKLLSAARPGCARPFSPEAHTALTRVYKHDGAQVAGSADPCQRLLTSWTTMDAQGPEAAGSTGEKPPALKKRF